MQRQHTHPETLRSLAGSALVGPGLFYLFGHLVWAAALLSRLLDNTAGEGMLSCVMLAASLGRHELLHCMLRMFWPLLLILGGSPFLWIGGSQHDSLRL